MRIAIVLLALITPALVADVYWVSPTGAAASWAAAESDTPLSGTACASLDQMRIALAAPSISAGDTVYLRGGAYTYNTNASLISMGVSGTSGSRITISNYESEEPVITNTHSGTSHYAVILSGRDYITVNGLKFVDFPRQVAIYNGSDYNEMSYLDISRTTHVGLGAAVGIHVYNGFGGSDPPSTHNWIHHCTLYNITQPVPAESGDGIKLGDASAGNDDSSYNTVENCEIYNWGHALTDSFAPFNAFRNNHLYNPGFKTFTANLTGTATGGSTTTMIDTTKDFDALGVTTGSFTYIHNLSDPGSGSADVALINSISTTTNPNDTLNFSVGSGSPTFVNTNSYSIGPRYFTSDDPPNNGKYGHRAMAVDSTGAQRGSTTEDRLLIEGNRIGHASSNPNNNGLDGLSLSAGYCIVRYNAIYGSGGPGIYFKNGIVSSFNTVYNNTVYKNGRFTGIQNTVAPVVLAALHTLRTNRSNQIKNNILWDNPASYTQTLDASIVYENNIAHDGSDPLYVDTDLTDESSAVLPNLNLQSGSAAIDNGGSLTLASGAGTGTSLVVDNANFFQDGSWGSSLSNIQADWIAVGTVDNIVEISSINYATNTITLASSITWSDNDEIWLYSKSDGVRVLYGSGPDIGAYESSMDVGSSYTGQLRLDSSGAIPSLSSGALFKLD